MDHIISVSEGGLSIPDNLQTLCWRGNRTKSNKITAQIGPNRVRHSQSDDLYDLVSDRAIAAKPLILTSNRAPKDWYPLFPNPFVAESLLDRLINTSHQVLMDGPSYRPRKRPGAATT